MEWIYKYFSFTAIIVGLGFLFRYLIQKKIDSYFNKQLEQYKQELTIITENVKYDINKKLFDFEAYASKKHTIYPQVYQLVSESWNEILQFRYRFDIEVKISMRDLNSDELLSYFYEKLLPITGKNSNAYKYVFKEDLYLSNEVSSAYAEALDAQSEFLEIIKNSFHRNYKNVNWDDPDFWLIEVDDEVYNKASEKVRTLKQIIYKELSYTHHEKEEALS